jgi:hypothetical protein
MELPVEISSGMATEPLAPHDLHFDDLIIRPLLRAVERDGASIDLKCGITTKSATRAP